MGAKRIVKALKEVLDWTRGKGDGMIVHTPGKPVRRMSFEEFIAEERAKPAPRQPGGEDA